MPQQRLDAALERLVTAELIFQRGTPPDAEYTFKHALVQAIRSVTGGSSPSRAGAISARS
jgi:hypothetical protein